MVADFMGCTLFIHRLSAHTNGIHTYSLIALFQASEHPRQLLTLSVLNFTPKQLQLHGGWYYFLKVKDEKRTVCTEEKKKKEKKAAQVN